MASTVGSRLAYQNAKDAIQRAGFTVGQAVLSQSFLRLEVALSTTQTLYQFPVLVNDTTTGVAQYNTENRLALQDAFYVSSMGLFFAKPSSGTATNYPLYSYPNLTAFSGANTATSLYNWYNSSMQITVNNRQIVPSYDLTRHYQVNQTQQTGATNYDQLNLSEDGFAPIEPGWVIVGSKQTIIQVQLKAAMAAVEANSRAVLIFRGHLGQNITSVR